MARVATDPTLDPDFWQNGLDEATERLISYQDPRNHSKFYKQNSFQQARELLGAHQKLIRNFHASCPRDLTVAIVKREPQPVLFNRRQYEGGPDHKHECFVLPPLLHFDYMPPNTKHICRLYWYVGSWLGWAGLHDFSPLARTHT